MCNQPERSALKPLVHRSSTATAALKTDEEAEPAPEMVRAKASNRMNNTLSADPSTSSRAVEAGKTTMMAAGEWNTAEECIPCTAWAAEGQRSGNNQKQAAEGQEQGQGQGQDGKSPRGARPSRSSAGSYRADGRRGGGARQS